MLAECSSCLSNVDFSSRIIEGILSLKKTPKLKIGRLCIYKTLDTIYIGDGTLCPKNRLDFKWVETHPLKELYRAFGHYLFNGFPLDSKITISYAGKESTVIRMRIAPNGHEDHKERDRGNLKRVK